MQINNENQIGIFEHVNDKQNRIVSVCPVVCERRKSYSTFLHKIRFPAGYEYNHKLHEFRTNPGNHKDHKRLV